VVAEPHLLGLPRERLRGDDRRLDLRLLPLVVLGKPAEERLGDHETEHGVAEELERLVVEDAARRVLGRARLVRERVLEQPAVAEAVGDAALEVVELVAQPDDAAADVLAVALDDAPRLVRGVGGDGDADVLERVDRHRPDRLRIARPAEARDSVAVEQRHHDARFDVGSRREDDHRFHSGVPAA
jgi:hypothetical protein